MPSTDWLRVKRGLAGAAALTLITAGLQVSTALASAKASPAFATTPKYGGTFVMAWASDFPTLDPVTWSDVQSGTAMQMIYDTLVTYNRNNTTIVPDLATSWKVSPNGLVYTFYLRHGVRFSNGDPVNAEDVAFSLNRVTSYDAAGPNGAAPYGSSYSDIVGYNQWFNNGKKPPANVKGLSGITVVNPYELQIHLVTPQAYFLNELALESAAVLDPSVVNKWGIHYELHAVGSGPFKLQQWTQGHQMVLVRNPYYWGPKPYLDAIKFPVDVPTSTQWFMFQRGQDDMMYMIDSPTYLALLEHPQYMRDYHRDRTNAIWYLALNTSKPPFNKLDVRLAVNYAIDRQALLRLMNGRWSVMTQVLPPAMPGYDPAIKGYAYNPRLARKLLKEAGYRHGINNLTYVYTSGRPFTTEVAEAIQQQLAAVGIHVHLKNIPDTSSYWSYSENPKNYNIAWSDWWQDYPDPEDFMFNLLDKSNIGGLNNAEWTNPRFEQLITEADQLPATQDAKRWKLYDQAEQIWYQQAPWVPLFYPYIDALIQPYVGPNDLMVYLHPVLTPEFQYMFINKAQ